MLESQSTNDDAQHRKSSPVSPWTVILRITTVIVIIEFLTISFIMQLNQSNGNNYYNHRLAVMSTIASGKGESSKLPATPRNLAYVDWMNGTYPDVCGQGAHPVKVRNGAATINGFHLTIMQPIYGAITGPGRVDAIVPYGCTGAEYWGTKFMVYTGDARNPRLVGYLPLKHEAGTIRDVLTVKNAKTLAVTIKNRIITIAFSGFSTQAGAWCCPDLRLVKSYQWVNHTFVLVHATNSPLAASL